LKRKNKYFPPVKSKNQFNFQELILALRCNLLFGEKPHKRISTAIRAISFVLTQKKQKVKRKITLLNDEHF